MSSFIEFIALHEKASDLPSPITPVVSLVSCRPLYPYHCLLFLIFESFVFISLSPYTPVWNLAAFLEYTNPTNQSKVQQKSSGSIVLTEIIQHLWALVLSSQVFHYSVFHLNSPNRLLKLQRTDINSYTSWNPQRSSTRYICSGCGKYLSVFLICQWSHCWTIDDLTAYIQTMRCTI